LSVLLPTVCLLLIAGILVEGFSSFIASMVGTGSGLSSFRDNVGVLGVTKVEHILAVVSLK